MRGLGGVIQSALQLHRCLRPTVGTQSTGRGIPRVRAVGEGQCQLPAHSLVRANNARVVASDTRVPATRGASQSALQLHCCLRPALGTQSTGRGIPRVRAVGEGQCQLRRAAAHRTPRLVGWASDANGDERARWRHPVSVAAPPLSATHSRHTEHWARHSTRAGGWRGAVSAASSSGAPDAGSGRVGERRQR